MTTIINMDENQNCLGCNKSFKKTTLNKYGGSLCKRCYDKTLLEQKIIPSNNEEKTTVYKKLKIPPQVRLEVWRERIGDTLSGKCVSCKKQIDICSFECAHIISEKDGGELKLDNLTVSCSSCNRSCGKMNLNEYNKLFPKDFRKRKISKIDMILILLVINIILSIINMV